MSSGGLIGAYQNFSNGSCLCRLVYSFSVCMLLDMEMKK